MGRYLVIRLALPALLAAALTVPAGAGADATPRVVGGSATTIADYPWQTAVVYSPAQVAGNARQRQICGGSLVTSRIVITAAHCLYDTDPDCGPFAIGGLPFCTPLNDPGGDGTFKIDANDLDIVSGRTTLSSSEGTEHTLVSASYQPGYNPSANQNDVGYLVLASSSVQSTIKIAGPDEAAIWAPGSPTRITGWGLTSERGSSSDILRVATAPIIADSTCSSPSVYGTAFDPSSMVCAGYLGGGIDTCNGDSGGPLQAPFDGGFRLVGITSWGNGCARPNSPGVYARIAGDSLRSAAAIQVAALEGAYGLPNEGIVGSGARPLGSTPTRAPAAGRARQLKRCKRLRSKKRRKRCIKRVRRKFR